MAQSLSVSARNKFDVYIFIYYSSCLLSLYADVGRNKKESVVFLVSRKSRSSNVACDFASTACARSHFDHIIPQVDMNHGIALRMNSK